jgi:hypothetical protein
MVRRDGGAECVLGPAVELGDAAAAGVVAGRAGGNTVGRANRYSEPDRWGPKAMSDYVRAAIAGVLDGT